MCKYNYISFKIKHYSWEKKGVAPFLVRMFLLGLIHFLFNRFFLFCFFLFSCVFLSPFPLLFCFFLEFFAVSPPFPPTLSFSFSLSFLLILILFENNLVYLGDRPIILLPDFLRLAYMKEMRPRAVADRQNMNEISHEILTQHRKQNISQHLWPILRLYY